MEDRRAAISRTRKKRLLVALLVLVVIPLGLVGGAFLFIQSAPGQALLRKQVLSAVDGALAGKVEAGQIALKGNHIVLVGLELFTPEGELVASIDRLEADVELGALARQQINLSQVKAQKPQLFLTEDARGWNLMRAVATKPSPGEKESDKPIGWKVQVEGLELSDGLFDLTQPDRRITATQLAAKGDAKIRLDPMGVSGALELTSLLTSPLRETLRVKLGGSTTRGPQSYDVLISLGGTRLRGQLELPSLGITIDELVAAPRELSAFLPGYPILPVVYAKGSLLPKQAALQLSAGKARVTVDAKYELATNSAQTLVVKGRDVDLQELIGASMPSDLGFDLTGSLVDWRPGTLAGSLEGKATWDAKNGQRLASAQVTAAATAGVLKVSALDASSPGFTLKARGTLTPAKPGDAGAASLLDSTIEVFSTITAKNLSQVAQTLDTFAGVDLGGMAGDGTIRVSVLGPLRGPSAKLFGQFKAFSIGGVQAEQLSITAAVPDVSHPLESDATLRARRVRFGERAFDDVTFDFISEGRQLDLNLATRGMGDLRLHALALLDKDARGVELQTTELTSTDVKWELEAPSRLSWAEGFVLSPFSLRDGEQRISGALAMNSKKVDATARVEKVDLARLPSLLAVPSLRLAGTLNANAEVKGKPSRPELTVNAQLTNGQVRGFDRLQVGVQGTWVDQRAKGKLDANSGLGTVTGTFDLPVLAFLEEKPGEGTAHFTVKNLPARELQRQLGQAIPVDGTVSAELDVSGSGDQPKVRLTVTTKELALAREPDGGRRAGPMEDKPITARDLELTVFTSEGSTLDATLRFAVLGSAGELTLTTPLTLGSLRKKPPGREELLSMPVTLAIGVRHLQLRQLDEFHLVEDDELSGAVSLSGMVRGSAQAPTGELSLNLEEVTYPPLRQASATVNVRTESNHTRVAASASVGEQKQALELNASVEALPERALAALLAAEGNVDTMLASLRDTKLNVTATLKPFPFSAVMKNREKAPGGLVSATLEASGTLEAPNVRLVGALRELKFDRVQLGSGRFEVKSTGMEQRFTIALGGEGRDDFKAKGSTGLDLRISKLRHGLEWQKAPIDLSLESRNFDVGFLSGASDLLRVVGGRVDLNGKVSGELGSPSFLGDAALRNGRLELRAGNDLVELKKLVASSGAGKLGLVAKGVRQKSGVFLLTSSGDSDKFPIVVDDQLMATASLHYELEGDASSSLIDIRRLALPRVDVALPEVKRKDLQDLERPSDIIVIRSGNRATRRQRQQAKKASEAAAGQKSMVVRVLIDAPRNIWVRSSDVNVELGLSEEFRVEYNEGVRLYGDARVIRGSVEVIGREFNVQKDSQARFAGPVAQPYVNVSALHVNAREQVKITVTVQGKGTDLGIKATSEPPMPESDIYAVLATGRRNLKTSGGATLTPGQAASVVGQLAASQLKTVIAKKLPIDVFNFDTSDNFEKFKLDVGKYLSDTVYLGGSVDIGARRERGENVWAGRLELQLTKSISLEAYAGDALSFGADAMWSRDF
jgi:translocation and assembly module TamB